MFRCLLGFGVGGGHTYASWFLEFVPAPHRGAWLLALTGCWTSGQILEAFFAWVRMKSSIYRLSDLKTCTHCQLELSFLVQRVQYQVVNLGCHCLVVVMQTRRSK